jgi:hypothetical protein
MTPNQLRVLQSMLKEAKARLFEDDEAAGHCGQYPPDYNKREREAKALEELLKAQKAKKRKRTSCKSTS